MVGQYSDHLIPFFFSAAVNSDTHEEVAIKKIGNAFDNRIDAKRTLREIMLLRHMDHENVSWVSVVFAKIITWFMLCSYHACIMNPRFGTQNYV